MQDPDSSRGGTDEGGDGHSFNHSFDNDKKNESLIKNRTLIETLEELEEGERSLVSDYNYEYDDWYNSDVDNFLTDPDGIPDDIERPWSLSMSAWTVSLQTGLRITDLLSCVGFVEGVIWTMTMAAWIWKH